MGVDVYLYYFPSVDSDVILDLDRQVTSIAMEERDRWAAAHPQSESSYSKELSDRTQTRLDLFAKEAGYTVDQLSDLSLFGKPITSPSSLAPDNPMKIGLWETGFSHLCGAIRKIVRKNIEDAFPKPENAGCWIRPAWCESRTKLLEILHEVRRIDPSREEFIKLTTVEPIGYLKELCESLLIMIETIDFVLNSDDSSKFLLYWSD